MYTLLWPLALEHCLLPLIHFLVPLTHLGLHIISDGTSSVPLMADAITFALTPCLSILHLNPQPVPLTPKSHWVCNLHLTLDGISYDQLMPLHLPFCPQNMHLCEKYKDFNGGYVHLII